MRILLLLVSVGLVLIGVKEWRLAAKAGPTPREMTCAELGDEGPGDNVHVTMTDFLLLEDSYVYEERRGTWKTAWVPAVPLGGDYHEAALRALERGGGAELDELPVSDFDVIVKLVDPEGEGTVSAAASREALQGMVINEVEELGREERKILEESYPGVDLATCWILEVGKEPKGQTIILLMIGGGVLVGGWVLVSWFRGRSAGRAPSPSETDAGGDEPA